MVAIRNRSSASPVISIVDLQGIFLEKSFQRLIWKMEVLHGYILKYNLFEAFCIKDKSFC